MSQVPFSAMSAELSRLEGITLVVPMRNEEESIEALLSSIACQTYPPDEIVLVDGGSTDRTVAVTYERTRHDSRFRIVEAGPATPGRGRNIGIAAAKNDWIALTDAGIRLEPTWLERLVAVRNAEPRLDVVYGNYEPGVRTWLEGCAALAYVPPKEPKPGGLWRGPFLASSLLRKTVWESVGGIPDLRAAEDLIFMERIQQRGFKIGYAPQAIVWWQIQPTLTRTFRRFALYSKHNVWAGRQRYWHYGVLRQYLAMLPFLLMAVVQHVAWLLVPFGWMIARVTRSIWKRRESNHVGWVFNPLRLTGVAIVLACIDLATFLGWAKALWTKPPAPPSEDSMHAGNHCLHHAPLPDIAGTSSVDVKETLPT